MNKAQLQNRTKNFAISVFTMVESLPKSKGTEVIAYQLIKDPPLLPLIIERFAGLNQKQILLIN